MSEENKPVPLRPALMALWTFGERTWLAAPDACQACGAPAVVAGRGGPRGETGLAGEVPAPDAVGYACSWAVRRTARGSLHFVEAAPCRGATVADVAVSVWETCATFARTQAGPAGPLRPGSDWGEAADMAKEAMETILEAVVARPVTHRERQLRACETVARVLAMEGAGDGAAWVIAMERLEVALDAMRSAVEPPASAGGDDVSETLDRR